MVERGEQACLDFLEHRQCVNVAEMIFCGNYEGSRATIDRKSSIISVLMQAFCPVLPGVFVTVTTPSFGAKQAQPTATNSTGRAAVHPERESEGETAEESGDDDDDDADHWSADTPFEVPFLGIGHSIAQSVPHFRSFYSIPKVQRASAPCPVPPCCVAAPRATRSCLAAGQGRGAYRRLRGLHRAARGRRAVD